MYHERGGNGEMAQRSVAQIKADNWAAKDREFAALRVSGEWPSKTCPTCQSRGFCCVSYNHHIGDNCLHCGNDERHFRTR